MKTKSSIITFLLMFFVSGHTQELVYVKGYTIYQYDRDDFWLRSNNTLRRIRNPTPYNFPLQVNGQILMNEKDMEIYVRLPSGIESRLSVFKYSPFYGSIKEYLIDSLKIGLVEKENRMDLISRDHAYYINPHDSVHIYQIRYIEGHAIRVERDNDYLNSWRGIDQCLWGILPMNRQIPSFYVYLFYDYECILPPVIPAGFLKWEPTPEELKQFQKDKKYR